jgi:hypothetical protein
MLRERDALIKKARSEHGTLQAHYRHLVTEVHAAFDRVIKLL